jgi:hypothetical protein
MNISRQAISLAMVCFTLSPAAFADKMIDTKTEDASIAAVEGASIKILSPLNGAHLNAGVELPMTYEVAAGKGGDHFHVWVDDKRGPAVRDAKGSYTLPKLTPGEHIIYIQVVDKGHVPTGPKKSISVLADAAGKS